MAQIFTTSIMQKLVIAATNSNSLQNLAYGSALIKLADRKLKLIEKFENHGVTQEIRAGPFATSNYLDDGNLNSFIGFNPDEGDKQLDAVKQLFKNEINLRKTPIDKRRLRNKAYFDFGVTYPNLKNIWDITPYPKGKGNIDRSGSWADDIESRGIGGLEYYIYLFSLNNQKVSPASRSGPGLQINRGDTKARGRGEFGSISYIRDLIKDFGESLK